MRWPRSGLTSNLGEPRTARRERQILAHGLPALGSLPASSLPHADIRPVLLAIEARGRGDTAHWVRAQVGRVLRYGVVRGVCERDVAADLRGLNWSLRDGPLRWVLNDVLHSARILVGRQIFE